MLVIHRDLWRFIVEILLLIIFWAAFLLVYGAIETTPIYGQAALTMFDVRLAFLFALSFMALSGFAVGITLLYSFYSRRKPLATRVALNALLFLAHFTVFWLLVGTAELGLTELSLALLGIAGVVAATVGADYMANLFGT